MKEIYQSYITSNIHPAQYEVLAGLKKIFWTQCVYVYIIHLHKTFIFTEIINTVNIMAAIFLFSFIKCHGNSMKNEADFYPLI